MVGEEVRCTIGNLRRTPGKVGRQIFKAENSQQLVSVFSKGSAVLKISMRLSGVMYVSCFSKGHLGRASSFLKEIKETNRAGMEWLLVQYW